MDITTIPIIIETIQSHNTTIDVQEVLEQTLSTILENSPCAIKEDNHMHIMGSVLNTLIDCTACETERDNILACIKGKRKISIKNQKWLVFDKCVLETLQNLSSHNIQVNGNTPNKEEKSKRVKSGIMPLEALTPKITSRSNFSRDVRGILDAWVTEEYEEYGNEAMPGGRGTLYFINHT